MALNILLIITTVFLLVFLEGLLTAFASFSILIVFFLFLFGKVDWKHLLITLIVLSIIFDIVSKFVLGTTMFVLLVPFSLYTLLSLFFSPDMGISSIVMKLAFFLLYFVLRDVLPNVFLTGKLGVFTLGDIVPSLLRALVALLLFYAFQKILTSFRDRGNTSQIRLK